MHNKATIFAAEEVKEGPARSLAPPSQTRDTAKSHLLTALLFYTQGNDIFAEEVKEAPAHNLAFSESKLNELSGSDIFGDAQQVPFSTSFPTSSSFMLFLLQRPCSGQTADVGRARQLLGGVTEKEQSTEI